MYAEFSEAAIANLLYDDVPSAISYLSLTVQGFCLALKSFKILCNVADLLTSIAKQTNSD